MRKRLFIVCSICFFLIQVFSFLGCKDGLVQPDKYEKLPQFNSFTKDTIQNELLRFNDFVQDTSGNLWGLNHSKIWLYNNNSYLMEDSRFSNATVSSSVRLLDGSLIFYNTKSIFKQVPTGYFQDQSVPVNETDAYITSIAGKSQKDYFISVVTQISNGFINKIFQYKDGVWYRFDLSDIGEFYIYKIEFNELEQKYYLATQNGIHLGNIEGPRYKLFSYNADSGLNCEVNSNKYITMNNINSVLYLSFDNQIWIKHPEKFIKICTVSEPNSLSEICGTSSTDLYFLFIDKILYFDGVSISTVIYVVPNVYLLDLFISKNDMFFTLSLENLGKIAICHGKR